MSNGRSESLRGPALITGVALLVITVAVAIGNDWAIGPLMVSGDAEATVRNIAAAETRFRVGILAWSVVFLVDLVAAYGFYLFLKPVEEKRALLMAWARLMYVAMLGTAIDNLVDVPLLAADAAHMPAAEFALAASAVTRALTAFDHTWSLGLLAFGVHVLTMAVLILRSGYVPRVFGYALLVAALGYFVMPVTTVLTPHQEELNRVVGLIFIGPMLSEVALGVWLLLKGRSVSTLPTPMRNFTGGRPDPRAVEGQSATRRDRARGLVYGGQRGVCAFACGPRVMGCRLASPIPLAVEDRRDQARDHQPLPFSVPNSGRVHERASGGRR